MAAWLGVEFGGKEIHVYVWQSLCCPLETITTLLIGYTLIQNKKFKKSWCRKISNQSSFFLLGRVLRANDDIRCEQKLDTKSCETFESSALGLYELHVR